MFKTFTSLSDGSCQSKTTTVKRSLSLTTRRHYWQTGKWSVCVSYPERDAHGFDLRRLAAQLAELVFAKEELLRDLVIICCHKTQNGLSIFTAQRWSWHVHCGPWSDPRLSISKQILLILPNDVKSTSSKLSRMLSTLAENFLNVEESIISIQKKESEINSRVTLMKDTHGKKVNVLCIPSGVSLGSYAFRFFCFSFFLSFLATEKERVC